MKFINRSSSTQSYRALWSHGLLAQGPKLQWGEPHSGVLGEATGGKAPEEINTAQPSALCSQHGCGVTWQKIPVGTAPALPSLTQLLLSLG